MRAARIAFSAVLAVAAGAFAAGPAAAQERGASWVELSNARVRLLAGPSGGSDKTTYTVGVEVALADGWKTYWRMPGDAGVPPNFDWSGSSNMASAKVLYPAPSRMQEAGSQTIGYKHSVAFPIRVVAADATRPVSLALALEFGVCREICIPAEAKFAVTLAPSDPPGKVSPALLSALDKVPRPAADRRHDDPRLTRATAFLEGGNPHIIVVGRYPRGTATADLFVEAPDGLYVPMAQPLPNDGVSEPRLEADDAGDLVRFKIDLSRTGNAAQFRGKTLRLTLVSEAGATEANWTVP